MPILAWSCPYFVILKIGNVVFKFRTSGLNIPESFHVHISCGALQLLKTFCCDLYAFTTYALLSVVGL